jgi:hypothetical protein
MRRPFDIDGPPFNFGINDVLAPFRTNLCTFCTNICTFCTNIRTFCTCFYLFVSLVERRP